MRHHKVCRTLATLPQAAPAALTAALEPLQLRNKRSRRYINGLERWTGDERCGDGGGGQAVPSSLHRP